MAIETNSKSSKVDLGRSVKWIALSIVIAVAIAITTVLNLSHEQNTTTKIESGLDIDNGDLKINWDRYSTYDIELTESLNITKSGIYHLTGSLTDGLVSVKVGTEGVVKLLLDNVSITNSEGPAIACYEADDSQYYWRYDHDEQDGSHNVSSRVSSCGKEPDLLSF